MAVMKIQATHLMITYQVLDKILSNCYCLGSKALKIH